MTRKDYILIATALKKAHDVYVNDDYQRGKKAGVLVAAEFIADALAADNPRFNHRHFIEVVHGTKSLTSRPGRS
jgi:hypothetical protein